jgi:hypothetical protein
LLLIIKEIINKHTKIEIEIDDDVQNKLNVKFEAKIKADSKNYDLEITELLQDGIDSEDSNHVKGVISIYTENNV